MASGPAPTIVILIHGRPATFGAGPEAIWGSDNALLQRIPVLIAAWRPGEEGGNALFHIITGKINPSGRLAQSWPREVGQVHGPGSPWFQTYQGINPWAPNTPYALDWPAIPLFPFGFGLSYGEFYLQTLKLSKSIVSQVDLFTVSVTVQSTSSLESKFTLQVYFNQKISKYVRYQLMLAGFNKTTVIPRTPVVVTVDIPVKNLGYWDPVSKTRIVDPGEYTIYVGYHSRNLTLNAPLTVF